MNIEIVRRSPVDFNLHPAREERRQEWKVTLAFENEGDGPQLVDLTHCPRWDLQDADIGKYNISGLSVPARPGECAFNGRVMINRMNSTQAAIWHLMGADTQSYQESGYTDVTEATVFLAIIGPEIFDIAERLTPLDLTDPAKNPPFLLQGPFAHVPCQVVVVSNRVNSPGMLLTCSRGYAHAMVEVILSAGKEHHLRPAGESAFVKWLGQLGPAA